ncbi:hypothetical protein FBU30_002864 [Linnemannia zychae]|nr:hypothetical protein FBU30_002864 [Linnemannia zychae]
MFNIDGDYNNGLAEADMTTLSAYLQQISSYGSNTLQKLVLSIFEGHPKHLRMDAFPDVLKAIPNSVQELHLDGLYSWREVEREPYYLKSYAEKFRIADQYFQKFCNLDLLARRDHSATTAIVTSAPQESLASHGQSALRNDGSHSLSLPGITKLVFENLSAYFEDVAPLIQAFENSNESINTSSIQDIDMRDWACTGLEVFRTSIHSIPRPDLDSQALSMTTMREVTLEESHRIQRLHYRQLGRLTKLKELVLGEFELDELKEMTTLYEEEDMEIQKHIAFGRGKDCLAMTLESG